MKKKSFTGLVILMSFSLIGIVVVQFLWMNNAINVRKEKFNATVYDALYATMQRMQREQEANFFMQQFLPFSISSSNSNNQSPSEGSNQNSNSEPYFPQHKKTNTENWNDLIPNSYYAQILSNKKGTFEAHIKIQENGKPKQVIIQQKNIDLNNSNDVKLLNKTIQSVEDSLKQLYNNSSENNTSNPLNVASQFKYELQLLSGDISKKVDVENLNRILRYELDARGIDLKYEYGIFNRNDGKMTSLLSNTYNRENSEFKYVANLFSNNYFRTASPLALDIYFPHKEQFLYRSLALLLSSSLIFTLFILITFFFTFRTILNQKKLSEIKSDFINNMTHEFKTPIATINLATDNINNPMILNKPEHIVPFLRIIKEENKRMNNQVERVLQMSLIEKSDFQLVPIETDLHILIKSAVDKMQLLAEQKSAEITTELNAELKIYKVDEVHFVNVIVNLLENALKYTKENTKEKHKITVTTQNEKNGIEITVKDNGIGMTKEQQAKVFEKFFRATRGNIHNVKGFGLGLSYVKAIMVQHGGNVYVKSKLGEGSEFKLFLPLK